MTSRSPVPPGAHPRSPEVAASKAPRAAHEDEPLNGILILIAIDVWLAPANIVLSFELARPALCAPWTFAVPAFLLEQLVLLAADVWLIALLVRRRRRFRSAFAAVALLGWLTSWLDRALAPALHLDPSLVPSPSDLAGAFVLNALVCAYVYRSGAAHRSFTQ